MHSSRMRTARPLPSREGGLCPGGGVSVQGEGSLSRGASVQGGLPDRDPPDGPPRQTETKTPPLVNRQTRVKT